MDPIFKLGLLIFLYCFITCGLSFRETIITEDKSYDVINFKVPQNIWKKALRPTPVLRSTATIVVPIHVSQEDNEVDDDELEDDVTEVNTDIETTTLTVVNDEQNIVQEIANDTVLLNATQNPIEDEVASSTSAPDQPVQGQVTRFPCSCRDGQCGCCTGSILDRVRMKACGNISFVPEDFVFDVKLSVNNNTVVRRRVSASDPPPICFNPRRAPFVRICAEISSIRIRNRNAYACLDINADIADFPVYSASFRCFGLGASGVQTGLKPKPVSSGPPTVNLFGNNRDEDDDDSGGFLDDAAGAILGDGDGDGGLFGGGGGIFGGGSDDDDDDDGPLGAIGDAVGDLFGGRKL